MRGLLELSILTGLYIVFTLLLGALVIAYTS